jgi:hypothetical protein
MNKYVFLDFDGVLNSHKFIMNSVNHFRAPSEKSYVITDHLDPEAIKKVNRILDETGANVVISTAWRKSYPLERLREMLESKGFTGCIISETKVIERVDRGVEIQDWLDINNVKPEQIVILDDMNPCCFEGLEHRLVNTSFYVGLLDKHVEEAIALLTD